MKNVVSEMNALKKFLDTEGVLRTAASAEFDNSIQNGPMRLAHDQAILNVIAAAQALLNKANETE